MTKEEQSSDIFDAMRTVVQELESYSASDQQLILRFVQEKLGHVPQAKPMESRMHGAEDLPPPASPSQPGFATDIKAFVESKAPNSYVEFAATVAYYHQFAAPAEQKKDSITVPDLVEACRKANWSRPTRPAQTLINAHRRGLLDKARDKGVYKLSTVGENLVARGLPLAGISAAKPSKRKAKKSTEKGKKSRARKK